MSFHLLRCPTLEAQVFGYEGRCIVRSENLSHDFPAAIWEVYSAGMLEVIHRRDQVKLGCPSSGQALQALEVLSSSYQHCLGLEVVEAAGLKVQVCQKQQVCQRFLVFQVGPHHNCGAGLRVQAN